MIKQYRLYTGLALLSSLALSHASYAQEIGEAGINISTLGAGIEYSRPINQYISGRFGLNAFNYDRSIKESDIKYDAEFELRTISAIADWHPFGNGFHVSGGVFYNGNSVSMDAKPSSGTFKVNNVSYSSSDIASASGDIDFNKVAPYLGVGWKGSLVDVTKNDQLSFSANLGVMYHGKPSASFSVVCATSLDAGTCARLQNDAANEQEQLEDAIDGYQWYPVVSLGVKYAF